MRKRRISYRMNGKRYMRMCVNEFKQTFGVDEVDADAFADWMVETGKFIDKPDTPQKRCKRELTRALSDERITDASGREVRANHCVKIRKGEMLFATKWFNIYDAKPGRMRVSLASRLRLMESQVHQHFIDWSSYNEFNRHGAQLEMFDYDFNKTNIERDLPTEYPDSPPDEPSPGSDAS